MNIELLQHTAEPERTVALAARLCYSPADLEELRTKIDSSDYAAFIDEYPNVPDLVKRQTHERRTGRPERP